MMSTILATILLGLAAPQPVGESLSPARSVAPAAGAEEDVIYLVWNERAARHLLNRAGFGVSRSEVLHAVEQGPEAVVERLLSGPEEPREPYYARNLAPNANNGYLKTLPEEARKEEARAMRNSDSEQMRDYTTWWVGQMLAGSDPLRDKLTLFWHGYFTSSQDDVKNSYEMIGQNQMLRGRALGSFDKLLHGIARDPAMLEYLDNDVNSKLEPNENFARELLELFSLGEGNYTEKDIQEIARALTGWTDRGSDFKVRPSDHDSGEKVIFGLVGNFDGDDVIELILRQPACARFVAGRLITWFEGAEPEPERLEKYSEFLRERDYELGPFLRRLFLDPAFYRDEVVGTRVAGPLDFLVGTARRLEIQPPPQLIMASSAALGLRLFHPPNVKGWEGGMAWITTSSIMQRGNLAGVLLGEVEIDEVISAVRPVGGASRADGADMADMGEISADTMEEAMEAPLVKRSVGTLLRPLRDARRLRWTPHLNLTWRLDRAGARSDKQIVDELAARLLAVEPSPEGRATLLDFLAEERKAEFIDDYFLLTFPLKSEPILRRLAHVMLSLPEAQLN